MLQSLLVLQPEFKSEPGERPVKLSTRTIVATIILMTDLTVAGAEEKYGVKVYDGAKYDAGTSKFVGGISGGEEAACYRASDSVAEVNSFYRKAPSVTVVHDFASAGRFKIGLITITMQSPWQDMKTKEVNKDTLLCMVKFLDESKQRAADR